MKKKNSNNYDLVYLGGMAILLIALFLNVTKVFADDTPTPNPTPDDINNVGNCPLITPLPTELSLDYYQWCSACVTPIPESFSSNGMIKITPLTPLSTFDLNGLNTPAPTSTPIPPTPTMVSGLTCYFDEGPVECVNLDNHTLKIHKEGTVQGWNSYPGVVKYRRPHGSDIWVYYVGTIKARHNGSLFTGYKFESFTHGVSSNRMRYSNVIKLTNVGGPSYSVTHNIKWENHPLNYLLDASATVYTSGIIAMYPDWGNASDGPNWFFDYDIDVYISSVQLDIDQYILAPTPLPYQSGYCSTYKYKDNSEQLASFTGLVVTQGACMVIIPQWGIHLPAVGELIPAVDWDINGISICPKYVNMGTFTLAGTVIPSDIIVIPAVMFLFGLIMKL